MVAGAARIWRLRLGPCADDFLDGHGGPLCGLVSPDDIPPGEKFQNLRPSGTRFGVRVSADSHPANPDAAKYQRRSVELRHRSGQSANDADLAEFAKSLQDFREKFASDIVDRQVHAARGQGLLECLAPFRVLRVERGGDAELPQASALL